ncbi:MAG: ribosomal L7Ae/L30e/S12e/Gadd45 family protein [Gemmatimonadales bacterium]
MTVGEDHPAVARLLGLGLRARGVVVGVAGVRARLARRGRDGLACVVLAGDASPRTRDKVERLALALGVPVLRGPHAERLGASLGRTAVQAVGVRDPALARGLVAVIGGVSDDDTGA